MAEVHGRRTGNRGWASVGSHLVGRWLLLLLLRERVLGVLLGRLRRRGRRHGTMDGGIVDRRRAVVTRMGLDGMGGWLGIIRGRRPRLRVGGIEGVRVRGTSRVVFGVCGRRARAGRSRTRRVGG